MKHLIHVFAAAALAGLMAGCATYRAVDSDVTAFPQWGGKPPGPNTAYRFERLPSQQATGSAQDELEAQARIALAKVGLVLSPTVARYSVQVTLGAQGGERSAYGGGYGGGYDGFGFPMPGVFLGGGSGGASVGLSFPIGRPAPSYRRDLTVLMRDLRNNQVVYETRARHDGSSGDDRQVVPAMLEAALRDFPEPASGVRRISVEPPGAAGKAAP